MVIRSDGERRDTPYCHESTKVDNNNYYFNAELFNTDHILAASILSHFFKKYGDGNN